MRNPRRSAIKLDCLRSASLRAGHLAAALCRLPCTLFALLWLSHAVICLSVCALRGLPAIPPSHFGSLSQKVRSLLLTRACPPAVDASPSRYAVVGAGARHQRHRFSCWHCGCPPPPPLISSLDSISQTVWTCLWCSPSLASPPLLAPSLWLPLPTPPPLLRLPATPSVYSHAISTSSLSSCPAPDPVTAPDPFVRTLLPIHIVAHLRLRPSS